MGPMGLVARVGGGTEPLPGEEPSVRELSRRSWFAASHRAARRYCFASSNRLLVVPAGGR